MKKRQKSVSANGVARVVATTVSTLFFACLALDIAVPAAVLGLAAMAQGLVAGLEADGGIPVLNGRRKAA